MVRYLDFNDQYRRGKSGGHPSETVAAVLAIADALHADGKKVITAVTLAYEVFCNFSEVLHFTKKGFDDATAGTFASAVGAGKILGLSTETMGHAIALSIIPNMALWETRRGELSMWKGCAAGNACRNGIFASLLADAGLTGPPNAIEGKEGGLWNLMGPFKWKPFGGRGGPFRIASTNLKYFASEYYSQAAISAALELRDKVKIDDIESITVETHWLAWNAIGKEAEKWHPTTRETADHSLPYIVAAALIDGTIVPATFSEERIRDPNLHAVMQKITVRENPEFTAQLPSSLPCRIEVVTRGGESQTSIVSYPKGHAKNPMTDTEVEEKFSRLCSGVLTSQQTGAILETLWTFEKVDDVGQVLALFAVPQ
jgi:2-methylcitrate dehydratase